MRNSARRRLHNRAIKSRLKTLESNYRSLAGSDSPEAAGQALRSITSALDKAAKTGVIRKATADRKKSRLAVRLAPAK